MARDSPSTAGPPAVGERVLTVRAAGTWALQAKRLVTQRWAGNRCRADNENTFPIGIQVKKQ